MGIMDITDTHISLVEEQIDKKKEAVLRGIEGSKPTMELKTEVQYIRYLQDIIEVIKAIQTQVVEPQSQYTKEELSPLPQRKNN